MHRWDEIGHVFHSFTNLPNFVVSLVIISFKILSRVLNGDSAGCFLCKITPACRQPKCGTHLRWWRIFPFNSCMVYLGCTLTSAVQAPFLRVCGCSSWDNVYSRDSGGWAERVWCSTVRRQHYSRRKGGSSTRKKSAAATLKSNQQMFALVFLIIKIGVKKSL